MRHYLALVVIGAVLLAGDVAWAQPETATQPDETATAAKSSAWLPILEKGLAIMAVCVGGAMIVFAGAHGISHISGRAVESIARQPEAAGSIFTTCLLTAAMIEVGMLFGLVLVLIGMLTLTA